MVITEKIAGIYHSNETETAFKSANLQERTAILQKYLKAISQQTPHDQTEREICDQCNYFFALFLADSVYESALTFSEYHKLIDPESNPFLSSWLEISDFKAMNISALQTVFLTALQKENTELQGNTTAQKIISSIKDDASKEGLSDYFEQAIGKLPVPEDLSLAPELRPIALKIKWLCNTLKNEKLVTQCQTINTEAAPTFFRIGLISAIVIVVITILISIFAPPDRSKFVKNTDGRNIVLTLVNWEANKEPLSSFALSIENKFDRDLAGLTIVLQFYNAENEQISSTQLDLTGFMAAKSENTLNVKLHNDIVEALYFYSIEEIGVTAKITAVNFNDTMSNDPPVDNNTQVLKEAQKPDESKLNATEQALDAALASFKETPADSEAFQTQLTQFGLVLDEIWDDVVRNEAFLEKLYQEGFSYQTATDYKKAYILFGLLETVEYADSADRAYTCLLALNGY